MFGKNVSEMSTIDLHKIQLKLFYRTLVRWVQKPFSFGITFIHRQYIKEATVKLSARVFLFTDVAVSAGTNRNVTIKLWVYLQEMKQHRTCSR